MSLATKVNQKTSMRYWEDLLQYRVGPWIISTLKELPVLLWLILKLIYWKVTTPFMLAVIYMCVKLNIELKYNSLPKHQPESEPGTSMDTATARVGRY